MTTQQYDNQTCPACQSPMAYGGQHGIRMGGVTGLKAAALDFFGGNLGQEANEVFEKKLSVELFVCENCGEITFKYLSGL